MWKVGFMAQWVAREYLARRGRARFKTDQIKPARCPLLGYPPHTLVDTQPEVGKVAYNQDAVILDP